jgi:hypothetical protein
MFTLVKKVLLEHKQPKGVEIKGVWHYMRSVSVQWHV